MPSTEMTSTEKNLQKKPMKDNGLFDSKRMKNLIIPLVIEQLLSVTVGMADNIMVSDAGEAAVSGISLVNQIAFLLIVLFSAMASGGSVVAAQYIGKGDKKEGCKAANQLLLVCVGISLVVTVFSLLANKWLLRVIFGKVEDDVMTCAVQYFYITAVSFPFLAMYNAGSALFRVMGNTKNSMLLSLVMNVVNIIGNAITVYGFHMGVSGVAYATLAGRAVAGVIIIIMLRSEKYPVHFDKYFRLGFFPNMLKRISSIGIPQALENSMFMIGKLLTQSMISAFGTASIAANACASNVEQLADIPGTAIGFALVTIVGQCVGANEYGQARKYTKRLVMYTYMFMLGLNILVILDSRNISGWYNLSDEGTHKAIVLIIYHSICCMAIWPLAFTLPNALRSAGDAKFTMISSISSMWIFRIGLAYIISSYMESQFGMGVWGVWIAMTIDWFVRAILNVIRFSGHRWETKSVVKA